MDVNLRVSKKIYRKKSILDSIPAELVIDIVARAATCSSKDLFNTRLSCKTLNKLGDDKFIIQHVSLDKFPVIPWKISDQQAIFWDRCINSGNSEAIYRRGIVHYFGRFGKGDRESCMECLQKAANLGHLEATYVTGMLGILLGGEIKQRGMKIISDMKKSKMSKHRTREAREKLLRTLQSNFWSSPESVVKQRWPTCCTRHPHAKLVVQGWETHDVDLECEACLCDQEILHVGSIIPDYI
ncbi:putative F-box protein At1g67623 [Apium graveolens]|uniref:putative F-box protein At1g67623 n=1 Tax=Apium graveolens TaxID=4045 RepID=UPI003D7B2493